jgi:hypothetical protein
MGYPTAHDHSRPPEGVDTGPGTPVNPSDPLFGEIAAVTTAAEDWAAHNIESGYAGDGGLPGDNMCNTGADDVPGA